MQHENDAIVFYWQKIKNLSSNISHMKTKNSKTNNYLDKLLIEFENSHSKLNTNFKKKDIEEFWEIFIDVSFQNWTEEELDFIDNMVDSIPDKIIENAAKYLKVGRGSIDWEFILCFWIIEPYLEKRKQLFLDSFFKIYTKKDLPFFLFRAYESFVKEEFSVAIDYLENLVYLNNELWTPRFLLSEIYQQVENYQNALIQSKLALEMLDKHYEAEASVNEKDSMIPLIWNYQIDIHVKISFFYEKQNKFKEAVKHLEFLIKREVELSNLYGHSAYLNNRIKNHKKAIEYANREIKISNLESAHWNKVEGLRKLAKKKEALAAFKILKSISKKKKALANELNLINGIKAAIKSYTKENITLSKVLPDKIKNKFLKSKKATKNLEREDVLENLLFLRINSGTKTFGKELEIFENKYYFGKQLFAGKAGILDLLVIEKRKNILWVVELKRNHDYNDAFEQTQRYMKWVKKNIAKKGQIVKGIICLFKPSDLLLNQVRESLDIELHTYEFDFKKLA